MDARATGRGVGDHPCVPGLRLRAIGRQSLRALALGMLPLVLLLAGCASVIGGSGGVVRQPALVTGPSLPPRTLSPLPPLLSVPASPAAAVILTNPITGGVYIARDADVELPMASTTKIMTALVAVTSGQPDQSITVGSDIQSLAGTGASLAGLVPGERLTLRELLYGLLLPSGDDAAIAIADGVASSQANFVALMNQQAQRMGLVHTHYVNVHGLDATGQYSSAADLASLAAAALRDPVIAAIVATPAITLPATAGHPTLPLTNTNELLDAPAGAGVTILGVKTGATGNAGYCLVFAASGPHGDLIGVLLHDTTDDSEQRFADAHTLLAWGVALEARIHLLRRPGGLQSGGL